MAMDSDYMLLAISLLFGLSLVLYILLEDLDGSAAGGRYVVKDGTVGGNAAEPERTVDMSSLSQIVFIGQFIQPHRFLTGAAPLSNFLLETIFEKYPLYFPVNPHEPHLAYNDHSNYSAT